MGRVASWAAIWVAALDEVALLLSTMISSGPLNPSPKLSVTSS
ncbi:MAG: hypothetical protein ACR2KJ_14850 [Jatrophihabitans sp.]